MSDYPQTWRWDEDGLRIEGRYVRFNIAKTRDGDQAILVLKTDGVERSVWLSAAVLRNQIADEVKARKSRDLEPAELVTIERGAEKQTSSRTGNSYWPFHVTFEYAAKPSPLEVLAIGSDERAPAGDSQSDDIPF